jgi:Na+(H+)/acetate symporter ActP
MSAAGEPNAAAIGFFLAFVATTLGITWWAARRTATADHFFAAGRSITAGQNGFALAGDYMSAASFLGIAGLVASSGFDGLIYSTGWLVGWPVVLFLIAEPLRNLGRYTFADVVAARLRATPVRIAAALSHDLWVGVIRGGNAPSREQLLVARVATVALGVVAVALGIAFKGQNVAFMVSLAFAIAASGNFPALVLAIFWPRCTTAGAVASMVLGTASTLILIWGSPTVQMDVFGRDGAWFPLKNPALVTIPLSFAAGMLVSRVWPEPAAVEAWHRLERRLHFGSDD